jgi:hypothetical protein
MSPPLGNLAPVSSLVERLPRQPNRLDPSRKDELLVLVQLGSERGETIHVIVVVVVIVNGTKEFSQLHGVTDGEDGAFASGYLFFAESCCLLTG